MPALESLLAQALAPLDGVRAAWLFGSRSRGQERADSDLDLAVLYPRLASPDAREETRRRLVAALGDALGELGERADLVDLDDCDPAVAFRAVSEGKLVLERDRDERLEAVVRAWRRYDDDAPRRELFRQAALRAVERMPR